MWEEGLLRCGSSNELPYKLPILATQYVDWEPGAMGLWGQRYEGIWVGDARNFKKNSQFTMLDAQCSTGIFLGGIG